MNDFGPADAVRALRRACRCSPAAIMPRPRFSASKHAARSAATEGACLGPCAAGLRDRSRRRHRRSRAAEFRRDAVPALGLLSHAHVGVDRGRACAAASSAAWSAARSRCWWPSSYSPRDAGFWSTSPQPARSPTPGRRPITSWSSARCATRARAITIFRPRPTRMPTRHLIAFARDALARAGHAPHVGATWTTDAPFRETAATIALRRAAGILAVEMEAAALYAFAAACRRPVICLAHVSNQLGCVEGDFEKGEGNGASTSLALVTALAQAWSARAAGGGADFGRDAVVSHTRSVRATTELSAMATISGAVLCAAVATLFWTCLGFALTRRLVPRAARLAVRARGRLCRTQRTCAAGVLLRAVHAAAIAAVAMLVLAAAIVASSHIVPPPAEKQPARFPGWSYGLAALLAMVPAAAVLPKLAGDGVFLADPVFDHAKVALIDDMARLGLPPGNPFFADGKPFAYYYLWHFGAAEVARLLGRSGWEADAGLTWFSAFASLAAMMGLAVWLSRRASAAPLAVLFAATASARYLLWDLFGAENVDAVLSPAGRLRGLSVSVGLGAAAHHLGGDGHGGDLPDGAARASSQRVDGRRPWGWSWLRVSRARPGSAASRLPRARSSRCRCCSCDRADRRWRFLGALLVAAIIAAAVAAPFLHDQVGAVACAQQGIADRGDAARGIRRGSPAWLRRFSICRAFGWCFCPIELTAIYIPGVIGAGGVPRQPRSRPGPAARDARALRRWSLQASRSPGSWRAHSPTTTISAGGRCCRR